MTNEQRRTIVIIVIALTIGLIAAIGAGNYIQSEITKKEEVASQEIQKNVEPLKEEITALKTELGTVRQQAIAAAQKAAAEKGPAAIIPQSSLAVKTPAGKRAVTVRIDSLAAVGGLINPGDFVDILAQMTPPGSQQVGYQPAQTITAMIFQNVQVLAVGTNVNSPGVYEAQQQTKDLTVTFALDPEEAGLLSFVQQNGKLQLALRSPSETESFMVPPYNWQTLADYVLERQGTELGGTKAKTSSFEPAAEEAKPVIQIFRGGREL